MATTGPHPVQTTAPDPEFVLARLQELREYANQFRANRTWFEAQLDSLARQVERLTRCPEVSRDGQRCDQRHEPRFHSAPTADRMGRVTWSSRHTRGGDAA